MYLQVETRYFPLSSGITTSCILSSTVWSIFSSGFPSMSWEYPNFFSFSTEVPIHDGLNWVNGEFVASNLIVPSLNVVKPKVWRTSPFSRGSAILSSLINSLRPLKGSFARIPIFSWAKSNRDFSGNSLWECAGAFLLHFSQNGSVSVSLQLLHLKEIDVFSPQLEQLIPIDGSLHCSQCLL